MGVYNLPHPFQAYRYYCHKKLPQMSKNVLKFDETAFKHAFTEKSTHKVLFSKARIAYLKSIEQYIRTACEAKKLEFIIDYEECTMEVATTLKTRDPYIIIKGGDMIELLSKGIPLDTCAKVLEDEIFSEIIPVNVLCSSDKTFERRKARISDKKILKALELLTKCSVFITGKVACIIGSYRGLNDAKAVVVNCFENIHPVFELKKLIAKKKLEKDNVEGSWDRFLPTINKTHSKKKIRWRETGGLPEDIKPRKEDIARETGEYYMNKENVEKDERREKARLKRDKMRKAKLDKYVVPNE